MKSLSMAELRRDAERRLRSYRKTCMLLRAWRAGSASAPRTPPPSEWKRMRMDRRVVDRVRRYLKKTDPLMERFMVRYFYLAVPERRISKRALHVKLMEEYNVSDSTLYKWKAEVLELVVLAAVQEGLVRLNVPENEEEMEE